MDPLVLKIAVAVRKEIVRWAEHLNDFAVDADDLCGACGIASNMLQRVLVKFDIESTFVMGRFYQNGREPCSRDEVCEPPPNHCWLEIQGLILDLTATQFGLDEEVFVAGLGDDRYFPHMRDLKALDVLYNSWDSQSPKTYSESMSTVYDYILTQVTQ